MWQSPSGRFFLSPGSRLQHCTSASHSSVAGSNRSAASLCVKLRADYMIAAATKEKVILDHLQSMGRNSGEKHVLAAKHFARCSSTNTYVL
jgi:hypothetical protein